MLLEICANSYQSAINAKKGGANRIELCEDLSVGGITPSKELIKKTVASLSIPVFVLIRPRGGDFVYSVEEYNQMKADIEFCKTNGCHGIVSGILNTNNTIDLKRTEELINLSKPLPFTFHKAFDDVVNPKKALEQLVDLGCKRILTSGKEKTAVKGLSLLKELKNLANNKIGILVGGSVRSTNAQLFKDGGFNEIHSAAIVFGDYSNATEIEKLSTIAKFD